MGMTGPAYPQQHVPPNQAGPWADQMMAMDHCGKQSRCDREQRWQLCGLKVSSVWFHASYGMTCAFVFQVIIRDPAWGRDGLLWPGS